MKKVAIAVREFALPVPRTGSIEVHSGYGLIENKGTELHSQVQKQRKSANPDYRAEVKISHTFERGGYAFVVSGRVDGLFEGDAPHIEEIKSTFDATGLQAKLACDPDHPYCLQLKAYAYFYHLQNDRIPSTSFHIVSSRTGESETLFISLAIDEFEQWLERRLEELVRQTKIQEADQARRRKLSAKLTFPFSSPRQGQTDLIASIERHFGDSTHLLIQAPTGLGKTVGVMYPVLKEALTRGQRIVYVTPKNSQHSVAEDAVKRLQKAKAGVKALTLTAKSKICFLSEPICNPEHCQYAKDYYSKVYENDLTDKLAQHKNLTARKFRQYAQKYQVCPFELSVEAIARADLIIGDYNYVFSPKNSLVGRLSAPTGDRQKPNLVVDEIHNLPARAAGYYSPSLSSLALAGLQDRIGQLKSPFAKEGGKLLDNCLRIIDDLQPAHTTGDAEIEIPKAVFQAQDEKLKDFLGRYLQADTVIEPGDPVLSLCWQWSDFAAALAYEGEEFFSTFKKQRNGSTVKITCCDASSLLKPQLDLFAQIVGFSATLKPFEYYGKLCGFDLANLRTEEFQSPFPRINRKLLVIPQVSTKYSDRQLNYSKIALAIERIVSLKAGNYFVFFPSFEFLQNVAALTQPPGFTLLHQRPQMKEADVRSYMDQLRSLDKPTVVFAVQGGVFSEGVDYPGNMIIGAIIVGPALPGYDIERECLRSYFEKQYGSGFDYAYTYPAMARVVQSAGRVIRSEEDRGLIVLMDQRFTDPSFVKSMPSDWFDSSVHELVSRSIIKDISDFWAEEGSTQ